MVRISILACLVAGATAASSVNSTRRFVPGAYIFELADGHDASAVLAEVGSAGTLRRHFDYKLFKGVSVQLHDVDKAPHKAVKIASTPGVKKAWPVQVHSVPTLVNHQPANGAIKSQSSLAARDDDAAKDTYAPHVMTQVDKLRAKGITGKGVKIAIIDTGIDYTHPALGGCFGPGCHISFGTDLVGDDYTGFNTPVPDDNVMDCVGHGTHVAGIIGAAANPNNFTGAALDATLGIYRVFGCLGQVTDDVLIPAFNMAFEEGADIITASIGSASGWTETAWSVVASRIVENGVPCTISAGNDGWYGMFFASAAAGAKGVTAVSSFDNVVLEKSLNGCSYQVDGGNTQACGYLPALEQYAWPKDPLPIYALSLNTSLVGDGCDPLPDTTPDLSGYAVLVRRGGCFFNQKAWTVIAKGAKYMVVYDDRPGCDGVDLGDAGGNMTAAGMVPADTGAAFVSAIKAGHNVSIVLSDPEDISAPGYIYTADNVETGGAASIFTSWGPTFEGDLKPQFGAPGGYILSTWPVKKTGYAVESGTSMSAPLVASVMALVGQVRGTFDPKTLNDLLSATAKPQLWNDGAKWFPGNKLAPVPQQGAGIVQAYDAAYATTFLEPSGLSFNDTDNFAKELTFVLSNKGTQRVSYNISHVPAVTMYTLMPNDPHAAIFPNDILDASAALTFSDQQVVLEAGHRKSISVSAQPPQGADAKRLPVWSGYIAVNGTDGTSLSLPYQGVSGSLHGATVLPADGAYVASTDDFSTPVPANTTFTLPAPGNVTNEDSIVAVNITLSMGSKIMRCDVVPMTTCPPANLTTDDPLGGKYKTIGQWFGFPYVLEPRVTSILVWDGLLDKGVYAPAGKYKLVIRALRIFGDESKLADWDVSETVGFYIKYKS
ncbi:subtilisin [Purpureocillium lavendulum]|uniref:Subtilisin n=1 Tax=Purpureocillium lavendulum TaxID=1247861 RepID=A0AB34G227_9HYPO|nr:subtilisin [Purpureocillium lavendulum]